MQFFLKELKKAYNYFTVSDEEYIPLLLRRNKFFTGADLIPFKESDLIFTYRARLRARPPAKSLTNMRHASKIILPDMLAR
jgi:hypothetical protein